MDHYPSFTSKEELKRCVNRLEVYVIDPMWTARRGLLVHEKKDFRTTKKAARIILLILTNFFLNYIL